MDILRIRDVGDTAFSVEFGDGIDPAANRRVMGLRQAVKDATASGRLAGLVETVPSFRALLVQYDPLRTDRLSLEADIRALCEECEESSAATSRLWTIPVCYDEDLGEDLDDLAEVAGLTRQATIELHTGAEYRVSMLGFMPGFAYMDGLPDPLRRLRRASPRIKVPAGSVALAESLCAVYPWESPGGWHLIGRTPVRFFDLTRESVILLAPGDRVRFHAVDRGFFEEACRDPRLVAPECLLAEEA